MNKVDSLSFLQSCIDKVKKADAQDIQFYREIYNKNCIVPVEYPEFEFISPVDDSAYELNSIFEIESNCHGMKKMNEAKYKFLGVVSNTQKDNDNLPYAA
mgnify:CR=1 FL=1